MTATAHPLHQDCQKVSQILARIGEKWSMLVVMLLRDGPRRFNDIKRNTGGISQQMLTRTLRGLERDGIVTRTIFPTSPPQVEYSLTELGRSMSEPVLAFGMGPGPSRRIRGRPPPVRRARRRGAQPTRCRSARLSRECWQWLSCRPIAIPPVDSFGAT